MAEEIHVALADRSYDIAVRTGVAGTIGAAARDTLIAGDRWAEGRLAFLVTDSNVASHCDAVQAGFETAGFRTHRATVPAGEPSKSLEAAGGLFAQLAEATADRRTLVVAVGGGVVGDLAGFVAASWGRGVPFFQVPTTLLAAVDSSVGGKTGVNIPAGKNLVGAFHQPTGVVIDTAFLDTLPDREFAAGMAEVVKYGMILDAKFFDWLGENVGGIRGRRPDTLRRLIVRCCELKAQVVQKDEFERTGLRAVLNYGHTFAHAYETLLGYGTLLHGEAVALGMRHAARLARRHGLIPPAVVTRQDSLLAAFDLPDKLPTALDAAAVIERMRVDKKSVDGALRFILPDRIGHVALYDDVPEDLVRTVLAPTDAERFT